MTNKKTLHLLRFDTQAKDDKGVIMPPFLKIIKEVSEDNHFSSYIIANQTKN